MIHRLFFSLTLTLNLLFPLTLKPAQATIGLAEWTIYTPGGNLISHADGWKERYGDCLRADDTNATITEEMPVYVAFLQRWRYYRDYVVGESRQGFFTFHEITKEVTYYAGEAEFMAAVEQLQLGQPKSKWLMAQDGWQEAWFPLFVWQPCQTILRLVPIKENSPTPTFGITEAQCREALSAENLALYRQTTWGRECRLLQIQGATSVDPTVTAFCEKLLTIQ